MLRYLFRFYSISIFNLTGFFVHVNPVELAIRINGRDEPLASPTPIRIRERKKITFEWMSGALVRALRSRCTYVKLGSKRSQHMIPKSDV